MSNKMYVLFFVLLFALVQISKAQTGEEWYNKGKKADFFANTEKINCFTNAIDKRCRYIDSAYFYRGEAFSSVGLYNKDNSMYEKAITDYSKAIQINPNYLEAYYKRGAAKSILNKNAEAITDFDKVISAGYVEAYTQRGLARFSLGLYEDALLDFEKAIQLNPKDKVANIFRENTLKKLQSTRVALLTQESKHIALVVGNSNYQYLNKLTSPSKDARDMASALRNMGFEVVQKENLTQNELSKAVVQFKQQAKGYSAALFYYSGHGMEAGGVPYILPVEVDGSALTHQEADMLANNVENITNALNEVTPATIVILDACRERLTKGSKNLGGQAWQSQMPAPTGMFIAFATSSGLFAQDGNTSLSNSAYTGILLRHISTPGLTINQVFKRVREDVIREYGQQHRPWENDAMVGADFYFINR